NRTTSPHRPPPLFATVHPISSHCAQIRGIWPPAPPPASRLRTQKPTPPHLNSTTAPPPPIVLHRRLPRRTPNQAIALGSVGFGPQPPLLPRVCERRAPPPPPPHPHHPAHSPPRRLTQHT